MEILIWLLSDILKLIIIFICLVCCSVLILVGVGKYRYKNFFFNNIYYSYIDYNNCTIIYRYLITIIIGGIVFYYER